MENKNLIYNAIQTPDGTVLVSRYRHDYVSYVDVNGEKYVLDGGLDYVKASVNKIPAKSLAIYDDSPHEVIREYLSRGSYGKDGSEELKYTLLKDIDYLDELIAYEEKHRPDNPYLKHYYNEREYRNKI